MPRDDDPFFQGDRWSTLNRFLEGDEGTSPWQAASTLGVHRPGGIGAGLGITGFLTEAFNVRDRSRARFDGALGRLDEGLGRFRNANPFNAEEANLMFAEGQEGGIEQSVEQMANLRSALGSAGVTGGGVAAGLATNIDLARMRQREGVKNNVRLTAMERNAAREREILAAEFSRANFVNQGPEGEDIGLNALGQVTGLLEQRDADREARDAADRARDDNRTSDFIGAGLNLISLFA